MQACTTFAIWPEAWPAGGEPARRPASTGAAGATTRGDRRRSLGRSLRRRRGLMRQRILAMGRCRPRSFLDPLLRAGRLLLPGDARDTRQRLLQRLARTLAGLGD